MPEGHLRGSREEILNAVRKLQGISPLDYALDDNREIDQRVVEIAETISLHLLIARAIAAGIAATLTLPDGEEVKVLPRSW